MTVIYLNCMNQYFNNGQDGFLQFLLFFLVLYLLLPQLACLLAGSINCKPPVLILAPPTKRFFTTTKIHSVPLLSKFNPRDLVGLGKEKVTKDTIGISLVIQTSWFMKLCVLTTTAQPADPVDTGEKGQISALSK